MELNTSLKVESVEFRSSDEDRTLKRREPELFNDHFQNFKRYHIPKAQLIIADIPYNVGKNAYGSNPSWYVDGDNANGESELAGKEFFDTDKNFRVTEFMHFCSTMLMKEPKDRGKSPCMIVFCEFEQQFELIKLAPKYGLNNYINLVFRKNFSAQVLKANMRVVGNCEYALILYRDKLPKFNNHGRMVFNCFDYPRDTQTVKIHPTQKSVPMLEELIQIFTDPGDVVIDPCAGSAVTLLAAATLGRKAYGFEIKKNFYKEAKAKILSTYQPGFAFRHTTSTETLENLELFTSLSDVDNAAPTPANRNREVNDISDDRK